MRWIFPAILLMGLTGCDRLSDNAAVSINLSDLNWQTGALILIAYLANSKSQLAAVLRPVVAILQKIGVIKTPSADQQLRYDEIGKALADLWGRLNGHPETQAKIAEIMQATAVQSAAEASNVSAKR